jgi:hypothetical protein
MHSYQLLESFTYFHSFSLLERLSNIICLSWISKNMDIFDENYKIDNFLFFRWSSGSLAGIQLQKIFNFPKRNDAWFE